MGARPLTLLLTGDVMLGRGVDQVLPHPGDPTLWEAYLGDARDYVRLAERLNGPVPDPVPPTWPWGDALPAIEEEAPDVRILNLETSVTTSAAVAPGKAVAYRMHPANLEALTVARPDVCTLANNHVLDFGRAGLAETLTSLTAAGVATVGAGTTREDAARPVRVERPRGGGVVVVGLGVPSSGIPRGWAATDRRSGVHLVDGPSALESLLRRIEAARHPGDVVVASVHIGSNWGWDIDRRQVRLAHALVEGGVDVVHGHSSHHPRPVEVYRGRLVLHGCGDLIDDYEGIGGHAAFRPDLRLVHLARLAPDGGLESLRMLPFRSRRLRLERAGRRDVSWLRDALDRAGRPFGTHVRSEHGVLMVDPPG